MPKLGWSPSQQEANQYAGGATGYGDSEQFWMELLAAECHKQWVEQRTGIPDVVFEKETFQLNVAASNAANVTHHVALHTNAGGGEGLEILYHPSSVEGKRMATILYKHISRATDVADRGIKVSTTLGELNSTDAYAVIIEYLFHDSGAGAAEIRKSIKEFATSTVKGMCEYYGKVYRAPVVAPPVVVPPVIIDAHVAEIMELERKLISSESTARLAERALENVKTRVRAALEG